MQYTTEIENERCEHCICFIYCSSKKYISQPIPSTLDKRIEVKLKKLYIFITRLF